MESMSTLVELSDRYKSNLLVQKQLLIGHEQQLLWNFFRLLMYNIINLGAHVTLTNRKCGHEEMNKS